VAHVRTAIDIYCNIIAYGEERALALFILYFSVSLASLCYFGRNITKRGEGSKEYCVEGEKKENQSFFSLLFSFFLLFGWFGGGKKSVKFLGTGRFAPPLRLAWCF